MKKHILTLVAGGLLMTSQAQLINQPSVTGTLFGALVGSVIGNSVHGQTWQGAAIGAGSGFVLGNLAYGSQQRQQPAYSYGAPYAYPASPGYVTTYSAQPSYYVNSYPYSSYSPAPPSSSGNSFPKYAVGGTLFGALVGGVIGNSVHHQGWEGAGIGAASGMLLGALADRNARIRKQSAPPPVAVTQARSIPDAPTVSTAPQAPAAPVYQPVNSMNSANSLFGR